MLYTTLENLKLSLGIDSLDKTKDEVLQRIIKNVSKKFENYLGFSLGKNIYVQVLKKNFDYIIVSNTPISRVLKISERNISGKNLTYSRIDEQIIYINEDYKGLVYVEYEAGFDDLTEIADVENICLEMCISDFNNLPISGAETNVKSKKIETLSKTYFSKEEMISSLDMNFREVLDNYKKNFNPLRI